MPHHLRVDPKNAQQIGPTPADTTVLPEFTFHHGHVDKVMNTNRDKAGTIKPINGLPADVSQVILVTPTFEGVVPSGYLKNQIPCQPLLRGISDSIATGDSVIYTQIGEVFYYLGPLNTTNNPNYTPDSFYNTFKSQKKVDIDTRKLDKNGYNINNQERRVKKAYKPRVFDLDRPFGIGVGEIESDAELESVFSDLSLEGRQGNSIQLGARFVNPHIIIKNNITMGNNGSVFGMLSFGNPLQNDIIFDGLSSDKLIDKEKEEGKEGYIGEYVGIGNDSTEEEGIPRQDRFNINFGRPRGNDYNRHTEFDQIIMFSDRITFDAQQNDLTMSALRNINIGSGQNISITAKKHTLIESENIYLGKQSLEKTEPMVLGNELRLILIRILEILNSARANVQGVALPLIDSTYRNLNLAPTDDIPTLLQELKDLDPENGEKFLSKHHYIQTNRS